MVQVAALWVFTPALSVCLFVCLFVCLLGIERSREIFVAENFS